jgi:hypothetical protein
LKNGSENFRASHELCIPMCHEAVSDDQS